MKHVAPNETKPAGKVQGTGTWTCATCQGELGAHQDKPGTEWMLHLPDACVSLGTCQGLCRTMLRDLVDPASACMPPH